MKVEFIYIWAAGFLILLLASQLFILCYIRNRFGKDLDKSPDIKDKDSEKK